MATAEHVRRFRHFTETGRWDEWDRESDIWPSHGARAVQWLESMLPHGPGPLVGQPLRLRPDQREFVFRWFEFDPVTRRWRHTEALKGEARGGAKTELAAALAMLELAGPLDLRSDHSDGSEVAVLAASWDNAGLLYSVCQVMAGGQGGTFPDVPLAKFLTAWDNEIVRKDGRPGRLFRVAAVAGTNEGHRLSALVVDELHELTGNKERAFTVMSTALQKRNPVGRLVAITTAGSGKGSLPAKPSDSLCWKLYVEGLVQRDRPERRPYFLFDWREAEAGLDPTDPEDVAKGVRQASGAADVVWRVEDRVRRFLDPTVPLHEHVRYLWNRWVQTATDSWLADRPGAWADCQDRDAVIPDGAEVVVGVDAALRNDTLAVVAVHRLDDGRHVWRSKVFESALGRIDYLAAIAHVVELSRTYRVREVVYDPRLAELIAQVLEEEWGIATTEVPQGTARRSRIDLNAYQQIVSGMIAHDGDPVLDAHVNAAVWRETEQGRVLSKSRSGAPIDALIAGAMASWTLEWVAMEPEPEHRDAALLVL